MMYELWVGIDDGVTESALFGAGNDKRPLTETPYMKLVRTFEAASRDDAMRIYYEHMGWGPYVSPDDIVSIEADIHGSSSHRPPE